MTFKTSTIQWSSIYIDSFLRLDCVCYSIATVNIGKRKQQVTELLLQMIATKFWKFDEYGLTSDCLLIAGCIDTSNIVCMKFLFPDSIIICYKHNHIIKLVKFSRRGGGGGGGEAVAPAALCVACMAGGLSQACPILGTACHAGYPPCSVQPCPVRFVLCLIRIMLYLLLYLS
jgi:hypothetical protein